MVSRRAANLTTTLIIIRKNLMFIIIDMLYNLDSVLAYTICYAPVETDITGTKYFAGFFESLNDVLGTQIYKKRMAGNKVKWGIQFNKL